MDTGKCDDVVDVVVESLIVIEIVVDKDKVGHGGPGGEDGQEDGSPFF